MTTSSAMTLEDTPIIAILRGVQPSEVLGIGASLIKAGVGAIEVPLNSPDPFTSIKRLQEAFSDQALIGAGTVLSTSDVARLADIGARLAVSPNTNPAVISASEEAGLMAIPGVFSPTDAFAAIDAGAKALKLFPAGGLGPSYVRDLKAVLPANIALFAVGGVNPDNITSWLTAGAQGAGIGSAIYKPGDSPDDVAKKAKKFVDAIGSIGR